MKPGFNISFLRLLSLFVVAGFVLLNSQASAQTKVFTLTPGKSVTIHGEAPGASGYQWYKDGHTITGANAPNYKATEAGKYKVEALNAVACPSSASEEVQVLTEPAPIDMAIVKKSEDKIVTIGAPYAYKLTVKNNSNYASSNVMVTDTLPKGLEFLSVVSWDKGIPNYNNDTRILSWSISSFAANDMAELTFMTKARQKGIVINKAKVTAAEIDPNLANNLSTDTKEIKGLDIPNVFTPNGDGKNDEFVIPDLSNFPENEIVIVNRWGNAVYQKKGYHNDWTGEGLNEGTYFYVLKVKNVSGEWDSYQGYVTLLRSK
ncbi:T9SS type B sorting domain-containing protein [Mucilaginibacter agri]|uniref:T9SS type B sorting domain-containing protein n=1 Tax=Mucilaginibacter agri TaxID=2695265 RepID=A0A965ZLC0_9SPHI|nr:gliding motility-associated C-terminal domain-containing protein [Mucilaginibacter agri]NCD72059.1 T9SS type B sorting domain-containing protein [Mucilaginibacter agri]